MTGLVEPMTALVEPLRALVASATPMTARVEPMTALVEPLGALVASATPLVEPMTALVEPMTSLVEPLGAPVASATPMTAPVEPKGAHDARCVEKRAWSSARCDVAYVRSAKCALISAQKRPKRPNAQSPNRPPARPPARARVCWITLVILALHPWCLVGRLIGRRYGLPCPSQRAPSGDRPAFEEPSRDRPASRSRLLTGAPPLYSFLSFFWLGRRRHDFSEEVLVEFSMLRLEF